MEGSGVTLTEGLLLRAVQRVEFEAEIKSCLVINFPSNDMVIASTWYEFLRINDTNNYQTMWMIKSLYLFTEIVQNKFIGTFSNSEDEIGRYFLPNGMPKFLPIFEVLFSETTYRTVSENIVLKDPVGLRLWLFSFDKAIDFDIALASCIEQNSRLVKQKVSFKTKTQGNQFGYLSFMNYVTNYKRYIDEIVDGYTDLLIGNEDQKSEKLKPDSKYQPKKIFSVGNAFTYKCERVCERQKNLATYFETTGFNDSNFVDWKSFKGFPNPNNVWYMPCEYFKPMYLYFFPLINVLGDILDPLSKKFSDNSVTIDQLIINQYGYSQFDSFVPSLEKRVTPEMRDNLMSLINSTILLMQGIERKKGIATDEAFAKYNSVIQFKLLNKVKYAHWESLYPRPSYLHLREEYIRKNIRIFWNVLMTSNTLPKALLATRDYWLECRRKKIPIFSPIHHIWKNVSFYASTQIFFNQFLESIADLKTSFQAAKLVELVMMASVYSPFDDTSDVLMMVHLLMSGKASAGKSFILNLILLLLPPGFPYNLGTQSAQDNNFGGDRSSGPHISHEASAEMLGLSSNGKLSNGNSTTGDRYSDFKHLLSNDGMLTRNVLKITPDGTRTTEEVITNNGGSYVLLSNFTGESETTTTERFINYHFWTASRDDKDASNVDSALTMQERLKERNFYLTRFRQISCLRIFLEKFLSVGFILPGVGVNLDAFDIAFGKLCEVLKKYHFPEFSPRYKPQLAQLVRTETIGNGVITRMFSPLAKGFTMDENGDSLDFDPAMFLDIRENLVATDEIVLNIFSLTSFVWYKGIRRSIVRSLMKRLNLSLPFTNKVNYLEELHESRLETDYRYFTITFLSEQEMVDFILRTIPKEEEQPSSSHIKSAINDMKKSTILSKKYELVNAIPPPDSTNSSADTTNNANANVAQVPAANDLDKLAFVLEEDDNEDTRSAFQVLKLDKPKNNDIQPSSKKRAPPLGQPNAAQQRDFSPVINLRYQELREIATSTEEKIPIIKYIPPRDIRERHVRYTLAVSVKFCEGMNDIDEREILKQVFQYKSQRPGDYFVSLPTKSKDNKQKYYHISDTINIQKNNKPKIILNPAARSEVETAIINASHSMQDRPAIDQSLFNNNFQLDDDKNVDFYAVSKHLHDIWGELDPSFHPSEKRKAMTLPENILEMLREDKNNSFKYTYPDSLISHYESKITSRKNASLTQTGTPINTVKRFSTLQPPILPQKRPLECDSHEQTQPQTQKKQKQRKSTPTPSDLESSMAKLSYESPITSAAPSPERHTVIVDDEMSDQEYF